MKNLTKIFSLILFGLFFITFQVNASEVSGNLNTGIDTGINGVVITVPTANPIPGTYTEAQDVALSASGSNSIYYTFDGTTPNCGGSLVYGVSIPVTTSMTIKALSCYANNNHSTVASFAYIINIPPPSGGGGGGGSTPPPSGGGGGGGGGSTPPPITIVGDINSDGKVNKYDFSMMMAAWGQTGSNPSDLNKDGVVDKYDFALLMSHWSEI